VHALVRLNHYRQAVTDRRGFLEVFDHIATTVGSSYIGLTSQVVIGYVDFIRCQQVAQVNHALLGVWCVTAVGVAAGELGELVVRVTCSARIALGHVQRQEARQQAHVLVKRGQAFKVIGVINVGMLWMQADKPFCSRLGRFGFGVFVVGVNQFKLGLVGVATERVA